MSRNKRILTAGVLVLSLSVFLAAGKTDRGAPRPDARPPDRDVSVFTDSFSESSWFVTDDGRFNIAGVTRFEMDEAGRTVIEFRRAGDFDLDPVVSLMLPVVTEDDGNLAVEGLESFGIRGDRLVLTLQVGSRDAGGVAGVGPKASTCTMRKPIPCGDVYCAGTCRPGWMCDWKIMGEDLICACQRGGGSE